MLGLFAAVHALYIALGVRFDTTPLSWFWQYLDVTLLRGRLAESLLYLHCQPPLFNLFLGMVLKLFPSRYGLAFEALFHALGVLLYLSLFFLMRRLGISTGIAFVLSTLFMASPSFVLYEEWLCYAFPLTVALVLSVLFLQGLIQRESAGPALGLALCLLVLCGTWDLFHLVYLVLVTCGLLLALPDRRVLLLKTAVPVICVLLALYLKNFVLFGHFAPSTWLGMNLARITLQQAPRAERHRLAIQGKMSHVGLIMPFQPLGAYPARYAEIRGFEGVPSLREVTKSTGAPNLNHLGYVALADQYLKDSLALAWHYPEAYLTGVRAAWLYYFTPTSDLGLLAPNSDRLQLPIRLWDRFFYGQSRIQVSMASGDRRPLYFSLLVGLPLLLLVSLRFALARESSENRAQRERRLLVAYMCFNILWVAVLGNSVEVGENNRFRFTTDPLSAALAGLVLQGLLSRWPRRRPIPTAANS